MCTEQYILLFLVFLCLSLLITYDFKNVVVYRFQRPSCPYCVSSQPEWNKFKRQCFFSRIKPIEINMNNASNHEKKIADNLMVKTVPHMSCVYKDGRIFKHSGERTADNYMKWVKSNQL